MPTEVPGLVYDKIQFVAFNVGPDTRTVPDPVKMVPHKEYIADPDDKTDLEYRCGIMKAAVAEALFHPSVDRSPNVLKLFMAPEFFFRGKKGGYPVGMIETILPALREKTDGFECVDWLFVFGTTIGFLEQGKAEPRTGVLGKIVHFFKPYDIGEAFDPADPTSYPTEALNIALVQKGWPSPNFGKERKLPNVGKKREPSNQEPLKQAVIYKEHISAVDFLGPNFNEHGLWETEAARRIDIDGKQHVVLPTAGSRDVLGKVPVNESEINESGLGGGSVFTIDDITFGLEVCRDHYKKRLHEYYNGAAKKGEPTVQIHLIPSCGISIGDGPICCTPQYGLVFNVDGSRVDSTARQNDKAWDCNQHPGHTSPGPGDCPVPMHPYWCASCNKLLGTPNCPSHPGPLPRYAPLTQLGTPIGTPRADVPVVSPNSATCFRGDGSIRVYEVKDLPKPDLV
jgi:hypothetical protein